MKKQVHHEGYNYVLEYDNNSLIMYKEDFLMSGWVILSTSKYSPLKVIPQDQSLFIVS